MAPSEVAAIFVEPIQGEGGYIVPGEGWMRRLRELCDEHGILLIADEVQCGMGRTGTMWAIEQTGVEPDMLLSAKGIASGLPLGAFIAKASIMEQWGVGTHGSTYGLLEHAKAVGEEIIAGLREIQAQHPEAIRDVRGVGLMIGVEFADSALSGAVQQAAFERGLLVLEAGETVVRMSPPLVVTQEEARIGVRIFGEAVAAAAASHGA